MVASQTILKGEENDEVSFNYTCHGYVMFMTYEILQVNMLNINHVT